MQFLTQALIVSAFVSAEISPISLLDVSQFGDALKDFTKHESTFVREVNANCGQTTEAVKIEELVNVIAKLKLVEADAEAKNSLATSLVKLQACQANLITLYDDNKLENVEKVEKWLALLDDDDLKAKLIAKNLVWLKEEAIKTPANQSTLFNKLAGDYAANLVEGNLVFEIFQALEKFQEREAAKNVLDVIYGKAKNVLDARPTTDLVKGLVGIADFKNIVTQKTKAAYEKEIKAAATHNEVTYEAIDDFLAILKDVHVKLINSKSEVVVFEYIVKHIKLSNGSDDDGDSSYFLKEVLKASKSETLSKDEVTGFVNRASDLNFAERRDDNLYNKYQDLMNATNDGKETSELEELRLKAFYIPKKWDTLPQDKFSPMMGGLEETNFFTKQQEHYKNSVVNIPVQFSFEDASKDEVSSSSGTVKNDKAYQFFNDVMDNIRDNTCVNFFEITDDQATKLITSKDQFIKLTKATSEERGCDEIVGKKPVAIVPTIQPFSELCLKGNKEGKPSGIAHYFMHHLGFDNEHQRPDADNFVKRPADDKVPMLKGRPGQNIQMTDENNSASFLTGTYDIESVMHWSSKFTEGKEKQTITHMRNGSPTVFSTQDYSKINNLYCGGKSIMPDCKYMVTRTNKDDFQVKDECLQLEDDKAKINGLADIYFGNSDDNSYEISATVVYKTETFKEEEERRLEGWEEEYAITGDEREGLTSDEKCGNAKIYLLNGMDNKQFCSKNKEGISMKTEIKSGCGKPMKLQYELKNGKKVKGFLPNLSVKDINYEECAAPTASLLEKASSSIIGLSVLLLTI